MYTLLLLFILCGLGGIAIGINTNIITAYLAYCGFIALSIILFIGVSVLVSVLTPKIERTNVYDVVELTDDIIVIDIGHGHSLTLSRKCVVETVMRREVCPKLEITTFHMDDALAKWFVPICLWPDLFTLYI